MGDSSRGRHSGEKWSRGRREAGEGPDPWGKPSSEYICPSPGDPPTTTKLLGLANLIPLAVKENLQERMYRHFFSTRGAPGRLRPDDTRQERRGQEG